ncbi:phage portal protein family protein [Dietzia alimentaria]|uniref:phage portal protein family protein n=1 Tax=Dietzia alimentaria TaxID=665550 RepID=UPI00029B2B78|nr:hypothetical protein [Dietzia alimentaria]
MTESVKATAPAPGPAPVGEVGYVHSTPSLTTSGPGSYWSIDADVEEVPELRWPQSISVFNRMRRADAQTISVLKAVTLPIRSTKWRIDPGDAEPEVAAYVAEQLGLPLTTGDNPAPRRRQSRFSWTEHLRLALLSLPLGHMFFEQVVSVDPATGDVELRKLAPRMPATLSDIKVADDGGLIGIEQAAPAGRTVKARDGGRRFIPVDRLVAYVNEREGADWAGTSLLRGAYKHWLLKDQLLRIEAISVRRNGVGVPVYTAPDGASSEDIAKGRKMANDYRAGDSAGAGLPYGAKLDLKGVTGLLVPARTVIEYHDAQIARTALAHFLNLDGKGGSYALASTQADLFITSLNAIAQMIADTTNQHVIDDLVDWQFGADVLAPTLTFDTIGSTDMAIAQAVRTLIDSGAITVDEDLEVWLRRALGAPEPGPSSSSVDTDGGGGDG